MKLKRFLIFILLIVFSCFVFTSCKDTTKDNCNEIIIEKACYEMTISSEEAILELKSIEKSGYVKYDKYTYIMKVDNIEYIVEVLRNETEIYYVDVIGVR